jgi:membrane associated rhomboid family serine protease
MSLEFGSPCADAVSVTTVPFWLAALGGVFGAAASIAGSFAAGAIGAALFLLGVVWFFAAAVRKSRAEDVRLATALLQGTRDALRFAWYLMP